MKLCFWLVNRVPDELFDLVLTRRSTPQRVSAFDRAPAFHWRRTRYYAYLKFYPGHTSVAEIKNPRRVAHVEEGWAVRGVGRRIEVRRGSELAYVCVDTPRWRFVWNVKDNRVDATPSQLEDPFVGVDGLSIGQRESNIRWTESHSGAFVSQIERLEGKEVEKITFHSPMERLQGVGRPIHDFEPRKHLERSGTEFRTRTRWFDLKTHLAVGDQCGCELPKLDTYVDYPAPESVPRELFTFQVPPDARLDVGDPALGRAIRSEGRQTADAPQRGDTIRHGKAEARPDRAESFAPGAPPTLEDITEAYRRHYQAVKTLKVVYERAGSPLIDKEVLNKHGIRQQRPSIRTIVTAENKLYYHSAYTLPATESRGEKKREKVQWYDGSRLIVKIASTPRIRAYSIRDTRYEREYWSSSGRYHEHVLFATLMPGLPNDNERAKRHRIPELFSGAAFSVSDSPEKVNGVDCVVVEATGHDKLWLDPDRGFALRRRELWREDTLWNVTECDDLAEVAPGVWMPKTVIITSFGLPEPFELPAEYEGKPYWRTTLRVKAIEANDPEHVEAVTFDPAPGARVTDERYPTPVF
jgi:hypothetical protein